MLSIKLSILMLGVCASSMMAMPLETKDDPSDGGLLKRSPSNADYFRTILETSPEIQRTVLFPKEKVTPELIKMLRDAPDLVYNTNFTLDEVKQKFNDKSTRKS